MSILDEFALKVIDKVREISPDFKISNKDISTISGITMSIVFEDEFKKFIDQTLKNKPTQSQLMTLWGICESFINTHKPSCEESIFQVDSISLACQEFVAEICNCVGYYNYEEKEDNV